MIIYISSVRGDKYTADYPTKVSVDTADTLKKAAEWDHVCAEYTNNHRSNANFIKADTVMMDIDNSDTEDPQRWITLEFLQREFRGFAVTSRNHLKEKNGKPPRPKFHVYFQLPEVITDYKAYSAVKKQILQQYPFFDKGVKDAARFFYGNPDAEVFELSGKYAVQDILAQAKILEFPEPPKEKPVLPPVPKRYTVTKSPAADWERGAATVGSRHTTLPAAVGQWKNAHYDFSEVQQFIIRNAPEPEEQKNLIGYAKLLWNDFDASYPAKQPAQRDVSLPKTSDSLPQRILQYYFDREKDNERLNNFGERMDFCESGCALYIAQVFSNMFAVANKTLYVFNPSLGYYLSGADGDIPKIVLRHLLLYLKNEEQTLIQDKKRINQPISKEALDFAKQLGNKSFLNNVYEFLLLTDEAQFYSGLGGQPHEVNINGEYYHLKTGDHRRAMETDGFDRCIQIQPENTPTPVFDKCLQDWFGKPDVSAYLWRFMGQCLTGDNSKGKFINFYGQGGNGKGKLLALLQLLLGDYAAVCDDDLIVNKNNKDITRLMAELQKLRLAVFTDVDTVGSFNMSAIKKVTGEDKVVMRCLYEENKKFQPECKFIVATNRQIHIRNPSEADRRRFVYIPFERVIPEAERDEHLMEKLTQELPGILYRVIQEAYLFYREGLIKSDTIKAYTDDYIQAEDIMGNFLKERTVERLNFRLPFKRFMEAYNLWLNENNMHSLSSQSLGRIIRERGDLKYKHGRKEWYFEDIDLASATSESSS